MTKTERGVNFKNVGGAASNEAAPITCTFVNEYQAPKLRVQKSIETNGGASGATSFNVDYKIVATNDGSLAANTGKLTDKPDFARAWRSTPRRSPRPRLAWTPRPTRPLPAASTR